MTSGDKNRGHLVKTDPEHTLFHYLVQKPIYDDVIISSWWRHWWRQQSGLIPALFPYSAERAALVHMQQTHCLNLCFFCSDSDTFRQFWTYLAGSSFDRFACFHVRDGELFVWIAWLQYLTDNSKTLKKLKSMTHSGSNYAQSRKEVLFWGLHDGRKHLVDQIPPEPSKLGSNTLCLASQLRVNEDWRHRRMTSLARCSVAA